MEARLPLSASWRTGIGEDRPAPPTASGEGQKRHHVRAKARRRLVARRPGELAAAVKRVQHTVAVAPAWGLGEMGNGKREEVDCGEGDDLMREED